MIHVANISEAALVGFVTLAAANGVSGRAMSFPTVLAGLATALLIQWLPDGRAFPLAWLSGALAGAALLLPLYLLRVVAADELTLLAMVGAFTGPLPVLYVGATSLLIGAGVAALALHRRGQLRPLCAAVGGVLGPALLRVVGVPLAQPTLALPPGDWGVPCGVVTALATLLVLLQPHG